MEQLGNWDLQVLLFFNRMHADWLDPVMMLATQTAAWSPLYLLLIFLMFRKFEHNAWFVLMGALLAVALSDQFTSTLMKPLFQRLRPSQDPAIQSLLHLVRESSGEYYRGGLYGFASSHAANTFAVAMYCWLIFKPVYRWSALLFVWAVLMTYTRIYLGVHFPSDVLVGGLLGMLFGYLCFRLQRYYIRKREEKLKSA